MTRRRKQNASKLGGIRQNMAISWSARIKDTGGLHDQFMHVIDVVPTILEVTGIPAPELVDGKEVQTITLPHTLPMILRWDESFDIGSDTLTGVNDADYRPPFPLTAKLDKLTLKVHRPQLSPEDIAKPEAAQRNNTSSE